MVFRNLFVIAGSIGGLCMVSETIAKQVDQKLWRPFRNYRTGLDAYSTFNMPEDVAFMAQEWKNEFDELFKNESE